jgi:alkylhydroperoxidase family enzyme
MTNALARIPWEACVLESRRDREIERFARDAQGVPNPTIGYFASVPWLARATCELHPRLGLLMHVDPTLADLVSMVVSQENSCRFCYSAVRAMLWAQGMDLARIDRIEEELARGDLPARTLACVVFGRTQSRGGPGAAHAACEGLRQAGVSDAELKEIAYAVAVTDFMNRVHTIPAIPARMFERMPEQWLNRLLRPIVGRVMRSRLRKGAPTALPGDPSPPYHDLLGAYAGSPIGAALHRTLEGMWASPLLTRRCKLLMLAVIARGLACEGCANRIAPALAAEGIGAQALERILSQLDGPELGAVERALVPFARDTIWYEPQRIQRQARALRERLGEAPLLEAIGVASLGNGLCRMGAVLSCAGACS